MQASSQVVRFKISRTTYGAFGTIVSTRARDMRGLSRVAFVFLWLFVFTVAWENVLMIPGFGTIGKAVGMVAFATGLLAIIDRGSLRKFAFLHALMGIFVVWGGFTYFWSNAPERTNTEVVTYLQLLLMVWLIRELASTKTLQQGLISAYVLGTYVSVIFIFVAFRSGLATHYNRFTAEGFNPGDLALMLVLSIPFSIYLTSVERNGLLLWLYRLHPAVAISCIFLSAARGAFIDLLIALLFIPLSFSKWKPSQKVAMSVVAACGLAGVAVLVPQSSWTRIASIGQEVSSGTLNERTTIWKAGLELFRTHSLQGVGVNAFAPSVQRLLGNPGQMRKAAENEIVEYVAHNTFVSVLVEEGIVGFALFVLILAGLCRGILSLEKAERRLWAMVLLVWMIGVMELTWEYRKPTWLLFGLLATAITSVQPEKIKRIVSRDGLHVADHQPIPGLMR